MRQIYRHRKTNAHTAAVGRKNGSIDTDDLPVQVKHRSARAALVNRGIRLDKVVIRPGLNIA